MFSRTWVRCIKKGSFSLWEKARMRGIKEAFCIIDPLSPTLSLWERVLFGRRADRSGF
jgi:hypothetical protein